ncbi:MAG TPA: pitrilysin family protein [Pyrinomonadaceae bacterium]|nr:pitrilysin family protein [Pyrinomonadaceae bacterium]
MKNYELRITNYKFLAVILLLAVSMPVFAQKNMKIAAVLQPSKSPIVTFRIQFMTGSADDPKGKEGLADLTSTMIAQGGSQKMTYDEIVGKFYPMAAGFGSQVDKEMTTFVGQIHNDKRAEYYEIIRQMLLEPGFREDDFKRIKDNQMDFLKTNLRQSNDEELGKERLYNIIYAGTPYEHHSVGTISSLEKLTIQDVKDFYAKNYTQANLVIGMSGGFDTKFTSQMDKDFAKLPKGKTGLKTIPAPVLSNGMKIDIVQRETRATAISMGFQIDVKRGHKDFPALALVASYFGQHRSSSSYLYGRIREVRGLNYGDYAYIEYFPRGMFQFEPDANLARQSQIFQMWIRPVEPQNANFTFRAALYEYDKLIKNGIDQKTFDETRAFLMKYVNILTQTKDAELGYALDSRYYGIGNYNEYMKTALSKLTLADVNAAIKKHLTSNKMRVVMVTKDAEGLKKEIVDNKTGTISYASPKPADVLAEDKIIGTFPIAVKAADVTITPVNKVFE